MSALAIKFAGTKKLAARVTRGGASLIDHVLPHSILENEYANRQRVADFVSCSLDFTVANQLRGDAIADYEGIVVVCATTAARWRNWPLTNVLQLTGRFPKTRFLLVGLRREILPEEAADLAAILQLPNVRDGLDRFSVSELARIIARAGAVVSTDTSTAHIANFFHTPGVVLFGPGSPLTLAAPAGLKTFHDANCPYHPCVQWKCRNQANWCMRKITPEAVGDYLAALPAFAA
ncbi:MAG TPA: glycosyltransferase family 9 protein [Chthoniobacterales bacterium]